MSIPQFFCRQAIRVVLSLEILQLFKVFFVGIAVYPFFGLRSFVSLPKKCIFVFGQGDIAVFKGYGFSAACFYMLCYLA